jgi:hypothetical protein
MLKKSIFIFVIFLPFCLLAQKGVWQESSSLGLQFPFAKLNYDARFRTIGSPDLALGGSLLYSIRNNMGLGFNISAIYGRGASCFEIGANNNLAFGSGDDSAISGGGYGTSQIQSISTGFMLGYRYQSPNKRFFLQIQHFPLTMALARTNPINKQAPKTDFLLIASIPYYPSNGYISTINSVLGLNIGYNLNFVKDTALVKKPSAYKAEPGEKLNLQHAFTIGLLDVAYDLRWRRPEKTDFALNFAYGYEGIFSENMPTNAYTIQALSLFREGKTSIETGLEWRYTNRYDYYYNGRFASPTIYTLKTSSIGVPIGFRLQPHRGFFMRLYAAPYKILWVNEYDIPLAAGYYNNFFYRTTLSKNLIDGINIGLGLGYTF